MALLVERTHARLRSVRSEFESREGRHRESTRASGSACSFEMPEKGGRNGTQGTVREGIEDADAGYDGRAPGFGPGASRLHAPRRRFSRGDPRREACLIRTVDAVRLRAPRLEDSK